MEREGGKEETGERRGEGGTGQSRGKGDERHILYSLFTAS